MSPLTVADEPMDDDYDRSSRKSSFTDHNSPISDPRKHITSPINDRSSSVLLDEYPNENVHSHSILNDVTSTINDSTLSPLDQPSPQSDHIVLSDNTSIAINKVITKDIAG